MDYLHNSKHCYEREKINPFPFIISKNTNNKKGKKPNQPNPRLIFNLRKLR